MTVIQQRVLIQLRVLQRELHHRGIQLHPHRQPRPGVQRPGHPVPYLDGEGKHLYEHHIKIAFAVGEGGNEVYLLRALVQEEAYKLLAEERERAEEYREYPEDYVKFQPDRMPHALYIAAAVKLRGEYARARNAAEYGEIEHEYELIHYRDSAHLLRADPADHYVIEQADEIRYDVLDENGYHHREELAVKRPVSEILSHKEPA